ncbi:MAG: glycosyltransferase family 87 protein [Phototrophicaceae bacterium]
MPETRIRSLTRLRPWNLAVALCLLYCLAVIAANDGDPLALVTIGTRFSEGLDEETGTEGYDGQFVYFIARDPASAPDAIAAGGDVPAYRFQRILLPALGMVLSLGQEPLIPWALLLVNLFALGAGTALLESMLREYNMSRWYAVGFALSLSIFGTVRLSLPEPLAYALALGGLALAQRERWAWSALLFALGGLAKETALVFPAAVGVYLLWRRQWVMALSFGVIAGLPFVLWQGALIAWFGEPGVGSGGALATPFEIIPFAGVARILTEGSPVVFLIFLALLGPFVLLPTLWGLLWSWRALRQRRVNLVTLLLLFNAGVMLFVPFSTYREPLGILRFIAGLQIAVILFAAQQGSQRTLRYSTIWFMTMLFLLGSDFMAGE